VADVDGEDQNPAAVRPRTDNVRHKAHRLAPRVDSRLGTRFRARILPADEANDPPVGSRRGAAGDREISGSPQCTVYSIAIHTATPQRRPHKPEPERPDRATEEATPTEASQWARARPGAGPPGGRPPGPRRGLCSAGPTHTQCQCARKTTQIHTYKHNTANITFTHSHQPATPRYTLPPPITERALHTHKIGLFKCTVASRRADVRGHPRL
jgi:hypothetical protein